MPRRDTINRTMLVVAAILAVGGAVGLRVTGVPLVWAAVVAVNVVTFLLYGFDKAQARHDRSRVPEAVLHGFALVGGTPGAFAGQLVFRHKTQKWSFRAVFWLIVVLQIAAAGGYWYIRTHGMPPWA